MISIEIFLISCSLAVNGCTSGFIELDLLKRRAEKIVGLSINLGSGLDRGFTLLAQESFNCSGTMTGLLLVGTIMEKTAMRDEYPEIQIWRYSHSNTYTRQGREEIKLSPGDFSPDGVLQYNLTTPIPFENEDLLGVYQPGLQDSVVRVYYDSSASTNYRVNSNPSETFVLETGVKTFYNQLILISPISGTCNLHCTCSNMYTYKDNVHVLIIFTGSSCTGDLLSRSALRKRALNINLNMVKKISNKQYLFPDITFTCNGFITKWIVGGNTDSSESLQPELQIWRNTVGTSYTKTNFSVIPFSTSTAVNIVEYIPDPPLEFQEGDILGVYQPKHSDSALVVYSQDRDGPANYANGQNLSTVNLTGSPNGYDYPLVTVEFSAGKLLVPINKIYFMS